MAETLNPNDNNENRRSLFKFGKTILDEDDAISLIHRICLQEEEELLKIKAGGVDDTAEAASSSSSSSKKVKAKTKISYGDICECFHSAAKLPDLVVRAQTIFCSRTALAHYNTQHKTEYKLVEPLVSDRAFAPTGGVGFHCNFTATKLKKDNTPSELKLFYADFGCRKTKISNIQCCIIDASTALHKCCPGCPRDLCHCPCKRHVYVVRTIKLPPNCRIPIDSSGAEVVLDRYNRKYGTEYEFVKVPRISCWLEHPTFKRTHCHFIAKLETPCTPHVSWVLFFADYAQSTWTKPYYTVQHCCILATEESLDALRAIKQMPSNDCCKFCSSSFLHPPGYTPQSLNLRKLMSKLPRAS